MQYLTENSAVITAALAVIAILVLAVVFFRMVGGRVRGREGARLGISEYHEIDKDRRLVLIRRDDVEHLLLIGGGQDIVVESGIDTSALGSEDTEAFRETPSEPVLRAPPRPVVVPQPAETTQVTLRSAPRPAVFGEKRPVLRTVQRDGPRLSNDQTSFGRDDPT
ncbi:hypothetical protein BH10PSE7_BH10PSE7_27010 [soil metagenome]